MAQKRLRGDQVTIRLVDNGGVQTDAWNAAGTANVTSNNSIIESEFLGETSKRFDAIFDGFSFDGEFEMFGTAEADLEEKINNKNARIGADAARQFDITFTESYPNGRTVTRVLIDVEFGEIKSSYGGRSDYVKMSFEGKCSQAQRIGL